MDYFCYCKLIKALYHGLPLPDEAKTLKENHLNIIKMAVVDAITGANRYLVFGEDGNELYLQSHRLATMETFKEENTRIYKLVSNQVTIKVHT